MARNIRRARNGIGRGGRRSGPRSRADTPASSQEKEAAAVTEDLPFQEGESPGSSANTLVALFLAEDLPLSRYRSALARFPEQYVATLLSLLEVVELSAGTRARTLTVALEQASTRELAFCLLHHRQTTFPDVLKVAKFLDSSRQHRQLTRRIEALQAARDVQAAEAEAAATVPVVRAAGGGGAAAAAAAAAAAGAGARSKGQHKNEGACNDPHVAAAAVAAAAARRLRNRRRQVGRSDRRLREMRTRQHNLEKDRCTGSLTGSITRLLRRWVSALPASALEEMATLFPMGPWRELCDLLHLAPSHFALPWFLPFVYGAPAPADSVVSACASLCAGNAQALLQRWQVPLKVLRQRVPLRDLPPPLCAHVASYTPLGVVLWYHEELTASSRGDGSGSGGGSDSGSGSGSGSDSGSGGSIGGGGGGWTGVDELIHKRLERGEVPRGLGYGKLMERMMYFQAQKLSFFKLLVPVAQRLLADCDVPLDPPVAVAGDASASMQVAIRTATIVASLLASRARASLRLFNFAPLAFPVQPRSITDVLQVSTAVTACGATAPAAALLPLLAAKRRVQFLVYATDEEENCPYRNRCFRDTLEEYVRTVNPSLVLVLLSFREGQKPGPMALTARSLGVRVLQFRLSKARPDLTKVDHFLGCLSLHCSAFPAAVEATRLLLRAGGVRSVQAQLRRARAVGKPFLPVAMLAQAALHALQPSSVPQHTVRRLSNTRNGGSGGGGGDATAAASCPPPPPLSAAAAPSPPAVTRVRTFAEVVAGSVAAEGKEEKAARGDATVSTAASARLSTVCAPVSGEAAGSSLAATACALIGVCDAAANSRGAQCVKGLLAEARQLSQTAAILETAADAEGEGKASGESDVDAAAGAEVKAEAKAEAGAEAAVAAVGINEARARVLSEVEVAIARVREWEERYRDVLRGADDATAAARGGCEAGAGEGDDEWQEAGAGTSLVVNAKQDSNNDPATTAATASSSTGRLSAVEAARVAGRPIWMLPPSLLMYVMQWLAPRGVRAVGGACRRTARLLRRRPALWPLLFGRVSTKVLQQGESYGLAGVRDCTLTLGSDSTHILCGACLLYSGKQWVATVTFSERTFRGGNSGSGPEGVVAVQHSGDTMVDGHSQHVLQLRLAALPCHIDRLFLTLCSCGPPDLSHFSQPHIHLAASHSPDTNLITYTLADAASSRSPSVVMGCVTRRIAGSAASDWAVTALGEQSDVRCCGNYSDVQRIIAQVIARDEGDAGGGTTPQASGGAKAKRRKRSRLGVRQALSEALSL